MVIDGFNEKTATQREQKTNIQKEITELKKKINNIVDAIGAGALKAELAPNRIEELQQEIVEKENLLLDNEDNPDITECWKYTKDLLFNAADIWKVAELDLKQRLNGLITPAGFVFNGETIQPIKNPHFISVLHAENGDYQNMGG